MANLAHLLAVIAAVVAAAVAIVLPGGGARRFEAGSRISFRSEPFFGRIDEKRPKNMGAPKMAN